ncbi:uncharacterized protein PHACADRAFT_209340 [Phanerochaete carnosa HHB-10118-sp]|uniref:Cytochrome P450 n=1 Tax=Phanerochaete carnosa (strain HHB-10118-sp) TaxID=650164 RepID=K5W9H0_PHACS|nr:uncharacterized protein PHACADRAFT_209340 [Phanerochaete carnosa HHB-10118-sp]EKM55820.1 hypothetical protein PHACADRAFT_209340 [Phanerochaete carnosa HHB-10118-sp]
MVSGILTMPSQLSDVLPTAVLVGLITLVAYYARRNKQYRLPPGPKGLPIVGNAWDLPAEGCEWVAYQRWGKQYDSDVIFLRFFGAPVVVLNSAKAALDLFEKRSTIYSDRQHQVMLHDIVGWGKNFAFLHYGDEWRTHRKLFHQHFNQNMVHKYQEQMTHESKKLLQHLLACQGDFMPCIRTMAAAVILGITFGMEVQPENDPYVNTAEKAMHAMAMVTNPGSYMVDYVPSLRYLPRWAPGAQFKRDGAEWAAAVTTAYEMPYQFVKRSMANGTALPSITSSLLSKLDEGKDNSREEYLIRHVTGTAYVAGADTTVSALEFFVLAMVLYPEVQKTAQEHIDRVVGKERLPTFEDRKSLPYISALMHEVLRWRPVTPLVASHRSMVDDEYEGYHIPAGSMVVGNAWAMLHNEERFPNPENFDPMRFITPDGQLSEGAADAMACFGFGRRICPGRHFALESTWVTIAQVLAALNIGKGVDEHGKLIEPKRDCTPGFLIHPQPFKAIFKPRSAAASAILQSPTFFD